MKLDPINPFPFASLAFDPLLGTVPGASSVERRLSEMRGYFADVTAFETQLAQGDPVIYSVSTVEPAQGDGQLHYGIGMVAPGRIGAEYFMTRGHLHAWRPAAEIYLGLRGEGLMLLEDERNGESRLLPLNANCAVYVPGFTAHRTINVGTEPLVYIGVYPANAGHDYGEIARRNFQSTLVDVDGRPQLLKRADFLTRLKRTGFQS